MTYFYHSFSEGLASESEKQRTDLTLCLRRNFLEGEPLKHRNISMPFHIESLNLKCSKTKAIVFVLCVYWGVVCSG